MKKIIFVDVKKCLGCRTCELECAVAHSKSKDLLGATKESSPPRHNIDVEKINEFIVPLQCRHCEDAPCAKICPTRAIERLGEDEPVLFNKDKCIGCKWCIVACPFGILKMDRKGKVIIKCDFCAERLKKGEEPACTSSCPTGALKFVSPDEIRKERKKKYLVELTG
ncbi:4Fe-4S ferredoxin [Candidatus Desantisbacteria bacterium CG_4_10_14_0_8_um_filter_48_22]|uniref:4Fe-4S ferredoxin n=1 Tax=Candidatus Desantisbacteria bacterium CG_4_10_14_0_8_um_filter_48_22 TaxID=1974543 RepID=A0A2M7SE21_9BACT|nr:MAG: 4Fe-4S ferredoxin [Candidatus Desantisbacteria bacterium CG1_02_49_89]PIV54302.1 MAG: 4Fe-4S ferredoxin [Candidatus Desantisbacteria bacterium CG02_land_8_20_14_3_00_49_13]PIZ17553.1 MAG: 4Fe-4S ferredoxin [Candidatus Desantisbacteria bacterium CG_4_10_14_0_8_um_filter_48_22]